MSTDTAAVIGAGVIGCSFATVFARAGWRVRIFDADPASRDRAVERVSTFLEQTGDTHRLSSVSVHDALADAVADVRWVQECTPEQLEIKRSVYAQLDEICSHDVVLASSAAALTMTDIAAGVGDPGRCVVVHPTNPPHLLRFVEVVAGEHTRPEVVEEAARVMREVGQHPAVLRAEIPGFVLNRLQVALEREAFKLLSAGVASVADIDAALTEGLAPRWAVLGPFAVEETNAASIRDLLEKFRDYFNDSISALDTDTFDSVDDAFIALAVDGVADAYGPDSHDELLARRDRWLLALGGVEDTMEEPSWRRRV
jgi:L-gulonate 3-dehydrogenase